MHVNSQIMSDIIHYMVMKLHEELEAPNKLGVSEGVQGSSDTAQIPTTEMELPVTSVEANQLCAYK